MFCHVWLLYLEGLLFSELKGGGLMLEEMGGEGEESEGEQGMENTSLDVI